MFQYDGAWISRRDAYEISPALPLRTGSQHLAADRGRLPQAFSDSAPDRWGRGVIQRAWKLQGLGIPSEVDYLLEVNDRLRMGALRYGLAGQIMTLDSRVPKSIDLAALEAASRRTERADETDADVAALMHAGSSLGGARPKASVVDERGHLMMAKFTSTKDDEEVVAWEQVCLDIAQRGGIRVPRSRLLRLAGRPVLLMDRFDREYTAEGHEHRVPYMSAMTLLDLTDGDASSMVTIAEQFQPLATREVHAELAELWSRAALNLMVANTDNHLRNHGFLRTNDGWTLSPLFDVTPATQKRDFAVGVDEVGEDSLEQLLNVSEYFELDRPQAQQRLAMIADAVDQWQNFARRHEIPISQDRRVQDAFAGQAREQARTLLGVTSVIVDLAPPPLPPTHGDKAVCAACGRPLRSAESIARGLGPRCARSGNGPA